MRKDMISKALVLGVIVLFITVSVAPSNAINLSKNIIEAESYTDEDLPDVVIEDVVIEWWVHPLGVWFFKANARNLGPGTVPGWRRDEFRIVVFHPYLKTVIYDCTYGEGKRYPVPPGDTVEFEFFELEPNFPGVIKKVYFQINPNKTIKEHNYDNNIVWAYYKFYFLESLYPPKRVSKFHNCSEIEYEGYYRIS